MSTKRKSFVYHLGKLLNLIMSIQVPEHLQIYLFMSLVRVLDLIQEDIVGLQTLGDSLILVINHKYLLPSRTVNFGNS